MSAGGAVDAAPGEKKPASRRVLSSVFFLGSRR
jgi:hypothetical protein